MCANVALFSLPVFWHTFSRLRSLIFATAVAVSERKRKLYGICKRATGLDLPAHERLLSPVSRKTRADELRASEKERSVAC